VITARSPSNLEPHNYRQSEHHFPLVLLVAPAVALFSALHQRGPNPTVLSNWMAAHTALLSLECGPLFQPEFYLNSQYKLSLHLIP
jgi:hypothetical protein